MSHDKPTNWLAFASGLCRHRFNGLAAIATLLLCLAASLVWGQPPDANYDESQVPVFELPDPLIASNGTKIESTDSWKTNRRPEILELFKQYVYGHAPRAARVRHYGQTSPDHDALNSKAVCRQVSVHFSSEHNGPRMQLLIYLPKDRTGPVPVFLGLNFQGNHTIHADPEIRLTSAWMPNRAGVEENRATDAARGSRSNRWPVELILSRGYGLATIYYGDIDPDFDDGFQNGVHPLFYRDGQTRPDDNQWGSIAAWAWGLSHALDYFETDNDINQEQVVLLGHSRLGKTALWAGACDERFAIVISNNSGCGGAALSRRRFGETVKRINDTFPHWFCRNFRKYNDRENDLPVDQHMLMSLIAPRPLYVASAAEDLWADPRGEYLSCAHATSVYRLFGKLGPKVDGMPKVDTPFMKTIGYHIRRGKHDVSEFDWRQFLNFADQHFN